MGRNVVKFKAKDGNYYDVKDKTSRDILLTKADVFYETLADQQVASFPDGADNVPLKSLVVGIDPVQNLHGQSSPYPAGSGKNKVNEQFFNYYTMNSSTGYMEGSSNSKLVLIPYGSSGTYYIPIDGSKTYTFSGKDLHKKGSSFVFVKIGLFNSEHTYIRELVETTSGDSYTLSNFGSSGTLYLMFSVGLDAYEVQLEEGSTATDYAPYENICPITGWTGAKVTRAGVNLIPDGTDTNNGYKNSQYIKASNGEGASSSNFYSSEYFKVNPDTVYTLYDSNSTVADQPSVVFYDKDKNFITGSGTKIGGTAVQQVTSPANAVYARCSQRKSTAGSLIQFEVGSTAHDAEEYDADTYSITWQTEAGTVYGGELDVKTGVLTIDRVIVDYGNFTWEKRSDIVCRTSLSVPAEYVSSYTKVDAICSHYKVTAQNGVTDIPRTSFNTSTQIYIADNALENVAEANLSTYLNGVKLVYKIASPTTVQLTPTQIATLLGQNNVFADTGNVLSIEYQADLPLYLNKITAEIQALVLG